jgi:hypothetical protein
VEGWSAADASRGCCPTQATKKTQQQLKGWQGVESESNYQGVALDHVVVHGVGPCRELGCYRCGGPLVTMDGNVIGVVAMKLSAVAVYKETGDLPQNVNYAVKSNYLTEVLIGIPGVERKLLPPSIRTYKDVVELTASVEDATALVISTTHARGK